MFLIFYFGCGLSLYWFFVIFEMLLFVFFCFDLFFIFSFWFFNIFVELWSYIWFENVLVLKYFMFVRFLVWFFVCWIFGNENGRLLNKFNCCLYVYCIVLCGLWFFWVILVNKEISVKWIILIGFFLEV